MIEALFANFEGVTTLEAALEEVLCILDGDFE